ncbi:MAG: hypothetical protein FD189_2572, partial [Elusimicrobia bacterium]
GLEFAPAPPDSAVYFPRAVAFPQRNKPLWPRFPPPPQRDPNLYPLCAMAFPP